MAGIRELWLRAMVLGVLAGAAGVWVHSSSQANLPDETKLPQPVVNTHVLMERFHEEYYKALRERVKTEPTDVAGWKVIEHNAVRIAEASNLVAIREVDDEGRAAWLKHAAGNQQAAMRLYAAARGKKFADVGPAYGAVIESCNACHKQHDNEDEAPMLEP